MKVVFASSEALPFCKTGGLADVAGTLPNAMAEEGAEVALFLPYYREVREAGFGPPAPRGRLRVPIGGGEVEAVLLRSELGGVSVYFVDCPRYFDRPQLYHEGGRDYEDNAERFAFFSRAVLEGCRAAGIEPDVFHCHDWQTGLLPVYLRTLYRDDAALSRAGTLFTVHNMAYQGVFPKAALEAVGIPPAELAVDRLGHFGKASTLKGGIVRSEVLNTVSPTYAREIQTAEFGMGLQDVLAGRSRDVFGVLNGLDLNAWDPATDKSLPRRYRAGDCRDGKAACKAVLQRESGLEVREDALLVGSVSRIDHQKGLDLAIETLPPMLERGAQYVLIGIGDPALERRFSDFAGRYRGRVHYHGRFDEGFAHRVYAGSDLFLMPSRFEPCGLSQMISMRYGTLPLGTRTGGLADTVLPHGFLADTASPPALTAALADAERLFLERRAPAGDAPENRPEGKGWPSGWEERVRGAMAMDFSWARSARRYRELYDLAVRRRGDVLASN
ncbi:MAG: glycogen/starch synthase [Elusimicrobiota bacterium]